ncbi:hypothetical protein CATYP_00150 [Corynebacterium atypicum]|uniref:Putative heavy-metal chelation domain-containing protein n=1 Tax=Corynebacterium atypicum TaxID=191610 RepID=A0ABM5QKS9_9CORY|nr:hypothetical protein CATYP_00150 [Corynebacterium atypicum]
MDRGIVAGIPEDVVVESASTTGLWARVTVEVHGATSIGIAYCGGPNTRAWDAALAHASTSGVSAGLALEEVPGRTLAEVAGEFLATSDSAARGLGMAAVNAWYSARDVATGNGFVPTGGEQPVGQRADWSQVFDPFKDVIAGKTVAVIGHHPAAPSALDSAASFHMLEVPAAFGQLPPAAEFIVGHCDVVFISGSAFINGSAARLIELARNSYCAVIGPSSPLASELFAHDVDLVAGIVADDARGMDRALAGSLYPTMFTYGYRVHRAEPAGSSVLD